MRNVFSFLGVIILCVLVPIAHMGLQRAQVETYEQLIPAVVTNEAATATMTLAELPEPNSASAIQKLKSSLTSDIPVVSAYDPETKSLTVDGLTAQETRNMEITYFIEASFLASLPFLDSAFVILNYLIVLGLIGLIIAVVINAFKSGD